MNPSPILILSVGKNFLNNNSEVVGKSHLNGGFIFIIELSLLFNLISNRLSECLVYAHVGDVGLVIHL
jgi:hypothetical protein